MDKFATKIRQIVRNWMLLLGMAAGTLLYFTYHWTPFLHPAGPFLLSFVQHLQPVLIFLMLFLTFCRIEPRELKPQKWQLWLLLIQSAAFAGLALLLLLNPEIPHRAAIESAMICLVCPTATACAVVTGKLGGDIAGILTYTIMINLTTAVLVPLFVPLLHPAAGVTFVNAFLKILGKVFPMLILPCLAAWFVRYLLPGLHRILMGNPDIPFYLFAVSLTLAITVAVRTIVSNENQGVELLLIAFATLLTCIFQFWAGKAIGSRHSRRITAGQALGQKNTVFAMWLGYTFMDPLSSVAGGIYSIWHNLFNTWQLERVAKKRSI